MSSSYPSELKRIEEEAIVARRQMIGTEGSTPESGNAPEGERNDSSSAAPRWRFPVLGLALSGGGIRSATFCLGILQVLARYKFLRHVDFLSTVSGGGYIGGCIGRFYDRFRTDRPNTPAADDLERELQNNHSHLIRWLRKHGNYLAPQGRGDMRLNIAVFIRNLLTVHLVIGSVMLAMFGIANLIRFWLIDNVLTVAGLAISIQNFPIANWFDNALGPVADLVSPWFVLAEALIFLLVIPQIVAYWLVSQEKNEVYRPIALSILFLLAAVLIYTAVSSGLVIEIALLALSLLSSMVHVELAWRRARHRARAAGGGNEIQVGRTLNYLSYDLGMSLTLFAGAAAFALIDSAGFGLFQLTQEGNRFPETFAAFAAAIATLMPIARAISRWLSARSGGETKSLNRLLWRDMAAGIMAIVLLAIPLVFYSFTAHAVFGGGNRVGVGGAVTLLMIVIAMTLAHPLAIAFVNQSSLAQLYSARLSRAYLGASNPNRNEGIAANVAEVVQGDDVRSLVHYRPHEAAGPLHLINLTVNQTVDSFSQLRKRPRKGENVAVSSLAISIGDDAHAQWTAEHDQSPKHYGVRPLGTTLTGHTHPLVDQLGKAAEKAEMLSLRQWLGISGAAIDPGRGEMTRLGTSLLMGLVNIRTGYWWDSGIPHAARFGFPKLSFVRRVLYLLPRLFNTHSLLLYEWLARFPGPWERFWHLSDGGFFENTGAYELIRRRLPKIIICDGSADPETCFECLAELARKVEIDFGAKLRSCTEAEIKVLTETAKKGVADFIGTLDQLRPCNGKPSAKHAALCKVEYADADVTTIVLLIKAKLTGNDPVSVEHYHCANPDFPHQSTTDQFFDEAQWESYRKLGEHLSSPLCPLDWFYKP